MQLRFSFTGNSQGSIKALLAVVLGLAIVSTASADVCVWRDPEKTMSIVFPNAADYKSLTRKISPELRQSIEKELGTELDPSERTDWASYRILDKSGKDLGRIIACAQKGEYGAIEVVLGVNPEGKVKGVYIQRSRERVNKQLKSREFLKQFDGKSIADPLRIGKDIQGISGGDEPASQVTLAVRKMLVLFNKLK